MTDPEVLAYVKAAAVVLELPLDEQRALQVATHLARTAVLAGQLATLALDVGEEPAEIYCPAAFPKTPLGREPS